MTGLDVIRAAMEQAVQDGIFPGAVLAARLRGELRCLLSTGRLSALPPDEPVQPSTIYDLASLTKPLATTTSLLLLVQQGRIDLRKTVGAILGELDGTAIGSANLRDLLRHCSGLPGWRPLHERLERRFGDLTRSDPCSVRHAMIELIGDEPLVYCRGERSLYSDLGFILLGLIIERVTGHFMDKCVAELITTPLAATPLLFLPTISAESNVHKALPPVAPTEFNERKGRFLRGEVHDENAAAMGGIAGHAGLFGTALAVLAVSGAWLSAYRGRESILDGQLVREFTTRSEDVPKSSWALGWDTPSMPSSSGQYFPPNSFGHLGYTGTSLWVDPVRELEVVFLSNRVHPSQKNDKIRAFRPVIHDLVIKEFCAI